MHSSWLVEIASVWAYHASARVEEDLPFPSEAVHTFWVQNRTRFSSWNALLTAQQRRMDSLSMGSRVQAWQRLKSIMEEILLAEPLSRVSVAIAARLESRRIDDDTRAILHNVYTTHQEVRHRCLKIISQGILSGNPEADELNSLRHYLEHWTDLLLGYFANHSEATQYSHNPTRVAEFSEEYSDRMLGEQSKLVWSLLIASCRAWLNKHVAHRPVSPRINQLISEAALGMIHPNLFDSMGLMRSHLVHRIEKGLDQAGETIQRLEDGSWEKMSSVVVSPSKPTNRRLPA
ncbi:hypothetical protein SH467x_001471 [Pirellulaceae bacterium SH467]|jgi:hypothetical protein